MRVLVWPYARQKREILLFLGVKSIEDTDEHYILRFKNYRISPVKLLKEDIFRMSADE